MPHSSSGYGEISVDRIYVVEMETAKEANDMTVTLEGQESSPPASLALVLYLHGQIANMENGRLVAVTFRDKAVRNGYYTVGATSSDLTDYQGEVATADWSIALSRVGADTEIDLQSRLAGAVRQNDFSLSGQRWHCPPTGHYAYNTGSTNANVLTRSSAEGSVTVYVDVPAGVAPKWGCPVADYKNNRVRITDSSETATENEMEGVNRNISASGWSLSNGLMNISPTASAGVLNIQTYSSGGYHDKFVNIYAGSGNVLKWDSATILRNDFEMCVIRLTASQTAGGRIQLDLTLRRGASFVEGYLQSTNSQTLSVHAQTAESNLSTTAASGYITRTTNGSNGNRFVVGSARSFTSHANGGVTKSSTTTLDFFWGATIGGAGGTNDTAIALRNQYIGAMPEITYAVKR